MLGFFLGFVSLFFFFFFFFNLLNLPSSRSYGDNLPAVRVTHDYLIILNSLPLASVRRPTCKINATGKLFENHHVCILFWILTASSPLGWHMPCFSKMKALHRRIRSRFVIWVIYISVNNNVNPSDRLGLRKSFKIGMGIAVTSITSRYHYMILSYIYIVYKNKKVWTAMVNLSYPIWIIKRQRDELGPGLSLIFIFYPNLQPHDYSVRSSLILNRFRDQRRNKKD